MADLVLYPFQEKDVARASQRNTLIASECGIGKTVEAITVVQRRREAGHIGPSLVLCNKVAKDSVWEKEINLWDPGAEIIMTGKAGRWPEGAIDIKHYFHPRHNVWVLAHHEAMSLPRSVAARQRRKYQAPKVWRKYVWENIIIDECHRYKSRKAMRWKWLKVVDGIHRIGMTGTAIESDPSDMWTMLHWLYPQMFPSYWDFRDEWCQQEAVWGGHWKVVGIKEGREKEYAELIAPFTINRGKRDPDVAPDLPPKIESTLALRMEPGSKQYKLYDKIARAKDLEVRLPSEVGVGEADWHLLIPNALAQIVRLQQVLADPRILGVDAPSIKQDWVRDYVEDNPKESMVIFSRFRPVAQSLAEELDAAIAIGGRVERMEEWKRGDVKVLCGTIAKMGESLNLQKATTAIFIDHEYSTIKMTQAYDRVDRIDITESKYIIHLIVKSTVDVLVMKALEEKWSDQELVWHYLKEMQDAAAA